MNEHDCLQPRFIATLKLLSLVLSNRRPFGSMDAPLLRARSGSETSCATTGSRVPFFSLLLQFTSYGGDPGSSRLDNVVR